MTILCAPRACTLAAERRLSLENLIRFKDAKRMDGKESSSGKKPCGARRRALVEAERRGDGNRGQEGELAAALREAGRRVAMATRSTKATMATVHPPCRDGNDEIDDDEGNESWRGGRRGQGEGSRMPLWCPISTLEGRRRPGDACSSRPWSGRPSPPRPRQPPPWTRTPPSRTCKSSPYEG